MDSTDSEDKEQLSKHTDTVGSKLGVVTAVQRCFNNPEMSDITLKLGSKTFYAHKFVLGLMSDVFRTMWYAGQRWKEGSMNELELQECEECVPVFPMFLQFLYTGVSHINVDTALPMLMLSDKYNIQSLKQGCENYMKKKVNDGSIIGALRWLSYAQMSKNVQLINACVEVVVMKMDDVVQSVEFLQLDIDFLKLLLGRNDLVVQWEYTIFDALCKWISSQHNITSHDIKTLMSYVRFPMMLPKQLLMIEKSHFYQCHSNILDPLFATAHRFRSIASEIQDSAFESQKYCPRNYTNTYWCHMLSADIDNDGFISKSIGVRCLNHPVILTSPEQSWQIKLQSSMDGDKTGSGILRKNNSNSHVSPFAFCASTEQNFHLDLSVIPIKAVPRCVAVDVSLFLVKRDRLVKHLQDITLYHQDEDERKIRRCEEQNPFKASNSGQQQQPPRLFNPAPMHFSFIFSSNLMLRNNDAVIKHCFSSNDLEHPAEVPCFKFAGPSRTTNSVKLALVFKPRFHFNCEDGDMLEREEVLQEMNSKEENSASSSYMGNLMLLHSE